MKADAVGQYLQLFETLRKRKRWSTDTTMLRFAALTLASTDLSDPATQLEDAARQLKKRSGWAGPMNSPIRYAVAAMILRRGLRPGPVHDRVDKVRTQFRRRKMRRGGLQEVLAALILVLRNDGGTVPSHTISRVQEIMRRWKQDHFWLTGTDDYPMAALHAGRDVDPSALSASIETVYESLRSHRFSRGNVLQLASHILALAESGESAAARRFRDLRDALRQSGVRVGTRHYDELALLTLTSGSPRAVIRELIEVRDRLRAERPKPSSDIALTLGTGLVLAQDVERSRELGSSRDIAAIKAAQAVLDAQTAAMAAVVATSAATIAATAGSS